jgi:hypothetical protein
MKFAKGIALGAIVATGALIMSSDETKKKVMKKGKQMVKRMKMSF